MNRREAMLKGILEFPGSSLLMRHPEQEHTIEAFWRAIWVNYLWGEETNTLHWYNQLGCSLLNEVARTLCHFGWIYSNSKPGRRWASIKLLEDNMLEIVSPDELQEIKTKHKYTEYLMSCKASVPSKLVRQNGVTRITGIVREGFRDAGNTQFGFDMEALSQYETAVKQNLTKSMDKIRKSYPDMRSDTDTYDQVSVGIYDWHDQNRNEVFTTGANISDSRGRAISSVLRKVANPIGNKDFRAALMITY